MPRGPQPEMRAGAPMRGVVAGLRAMAADRIAVWDGHNYAVEVVESLGLTDRGGVVRAGLARYLDPDDVQRLLRVVERLAAWS